MRLNPEHFRALKLLGSALYALGDLEGAECALRDSLAINPDYSDTHSDLGARPLQVNKKPCTFSVPGLMAWLFWDCFVLSLGSLEEGESPVSLTAQLSARQ